MVLHTGEVSGFGYRVGSTRLELAAGRRRSRSCPRSRWKGILDYLLTTEKIHNKHLEENDTRERVQFCFGFSDEWSDMLRTSDATESACKDTVTLEFAGQKGFCGTQLHLWRKKRLRRKVGSRLYRWEQFFTAFTTLLFSFDAV